MPGRVLRCPEEDPVDENQSRLRALLGKLTLWVFWAAADASMAFPDQQRLLADWFGSRPYMILRQEAYADSPADPQATLSGVTALWKQVLDLLRVRKLQSLSDEVKTECVKLVNLFRDEVQRARIGRTWAFRFARTSARLAIEEFVDKCFGESAP